MASDRTDKRERGAYYTPDALAEFMAGWLLRKGTTSVLEPSSGDGSFLRAIARVAQRRMLCPPTMTAVELSEQAISSASSHSDCASVSFVHSDFLKYQRADFASVIGNPPFVRLRHLLPEERTAALSAAEHALGHVMDPSGSVWMPFVLHASRRLLDGGDLAMVLPLDATYVRYARPFWRKLAQTFTGLRVVRVRERLFPDLSQDVVVLFAEGRGGQCASVNFEAYSSLDALVVNQAEARTHVTIDGIVRGERAFLRALLHPSLHELLQVRLAGKLVDAGRLARFRIGYVAGDKEYFHPSRDTIESYGLRQRSLVPTVASARSLRLAGLYTSSIARAQQEQLFLPRANELSDGERQYVDVGELTGVSEAYKCRIRDPWFVVPYVTPPDIIISVFSDRPVLAVNDGGRVASNSFLCANILEGSREGLAARWYNSLTLLQCELNVHSLGGGVFVLVPREAASVQVLHDVGSPRMLLDEIDYSLRRGQVSTAYECGDQLTLCEQIGLSSAEIDLIRTGIDTLRAWRTPASAGERVASVEEIDEQLALLEA